MRSFLAALFIVGVPVSFAIWVTTSPRFSLSQVAITGSQRVAMAEISTLVEPLRGRQLLALDLGQLERGLASHRWIEQTTIRKELPDRLVIEIHERQPVALWRRDGDLFYIDRSGFVIEPYDPSGPVDLIILSGDITVPTDVSRALATAAELGRVAPAWGAGLSEIEILGDEGCRIHTAALPFPLALSAGRVEQQVDRLRRVMPEIIRRYGAVAAVDLRFSRQIVIQPAAQPRSQEG